MAALVKLRAGLGWAGLGWAGVQEKGNAAGNCVVTRYWAEGGGERGDTASLLLLASPHIIPLSLPLQTTEPLVVKWTLPLLELELESGEK